MELDPACSCTSSRQASATECTKDQPRSSMQRVTVHTGGQMSGTRPSVQLYILHPRQDHTSAETGCINTGGRMTEIDPACVAVSIL